MTRRRANILRVAAAWTIFVWLVFVRNLVGSDNSTGFKVVHLVLAAVSVAFAFAILYVASAERRR